MLESVTPRHEGRKRCSQGLRPTINGQGPVAAVTLVRKWRGKWNRCTTEAGMT